MTRADPGRPIRLTLNAAVRWAERHLPDALDLPLARFLAAVNAEAARRGLPAFELVDGGGRR